MTTDRTNYFFLQSMIEFSLDMLTLYEKSTDHEERDSYLRAIQVALGKAMEEL